MSPRSAAAPKNESSVSLNSLSVVTTYLIRAFGKMLLTTRDALTRSGSRHITSSPCGFSSSGHHWCSATYSRLRFLRRSIGLTRSGLNGSYFTPKNLASASPIEAGLTLNSSTSTVSMSSAFLRAVRAAVSSSAAEITASATRKSYFDFGTASFERCLSAIASVLHSSTMPSSASGPNGPPALLLISWTTPSRSPAGASRIGATSICLVR